VRTPLARAGPGRGATSPAPSSRRPTSTNAVAESAPAPASSNSSGHHRSSAYGRIDCAHPIGESHESVPSPTSPAARTMYDAPSTAPTSPYAPPVLWLTCIATTATPANSRPAPPSDAPRAIEPAAGWSSPIIVSATRAASSTFTTVTTTIVAAVGAYRPTTLARTSSLRPLCSSPRVWRPMMNMLASAAVMAPSPPHCQAVSPPTFVTA
jgi:hypothetical protein